MGRHTYDCKKCKRTLVYYQNYKPKMCGKCTRLGTADWQVGGI